MKRIIICSDGTWNSPEKELVSNVTKTARAIQPTDKQGVIQTVFYDWGLGSYHDERVAGITGKGIDKNIRDGYRFLVHNYQTGDEVFLFGYSRGAYTARSLGGFIRNCGILKSEHADRIPEAYSLYRNRREKPWQERSREFRRSYSYQPNITFMGVWDTVGALGIPLNILEDGNLKKRQFHDTSLSRIIKYGCHAMGIDEVRDDFRPTYWIGSPSRGQTIKQAWFAGTHGNVGGGLKDTGLSDITLYWMLTHAEKAGLAINKPYLRRIMHSNPEGQIHQSRTGIYKLRPTYERPIGMLGPRLEEIHSSVKKRWEAKKSYRPKNLQRCLEQNRLEW